MRGGSLTARGALWTGRVICLMVRFGFLRVGEGLRR